MKKIGYGILLTLLLASTFTFALNLQPAESDYVWSEIIYIHADGSVEPFGAPIENVNNVTYTLTDNIVADSIPFGLSIIAIERDSIVFDGAGYTLQGTESGNGIYLYGRTNVTIKNTHIKNFWHGIYVDSSSYNSLRGSNITNNRVGIAFVYSSSNNSVIGNNITANTDNGIWLGSSSNYNSISGNDITNNGIGIGLGSSPNNSVTGNKITGNNEHGIYLSNSSNNSLAGNSVTNNDYGVYLNCSPNNSISRNNMTANHQGGIYLNSSSNNTIFGNTITNNYYGVWLEDSHDNSVYINAFSNNTRQVNSIDSINCWNLDYSQGGAGNYWSDYFGLDNYGGPNQNVSGSDFIGDSPYVIDTNNIDFGPLMLPCVNLFERYDTFLRVVGDSMAPTILEKDIVCLKNTTDASEISVGQYPYGDLVVHRDPNNHQVLVLRRAINKWFENGTWFFTVKSDNRSNMVNVTMDLIIGKVVSLFRSFDIIIDNATLHSIIVSNSTLGILTFDTLSKQLSFNVTGFLTHATTSLCEVFISRGIFNTILDVKVNNLSIPFIKIDYGAVKFVSIEIPQTSYDVEIIGESVVTYRFQVSAETVLYNVSANTNSVISDFSFNEGNKTISFYVEGFSGTGGFCNLTLPLGLMGGPYTVKVNNDVVLQDYNAPTNGTHAFIYFTYEHSTHKVVIVPEFPSFLILPLLMAVTLLAAVVCRRKRTT